MRRLTVAILFVALVAWSVDAEEPVTPALTAYKLDFGEVTAHEQVIAIRNGVVETVACDFYYCTISTWDLKTGKRLTTYESSKLGYPLLGVDEMAGYDRKEGKLHRTVDLMTKPREIEALDVGKGLKTPWETDPDCGMVQVEYYSPDWWVLVGAKEYVFASRKGNKVVRVPIVTTGNVRLEVSAHVAVLDESGGWSRPYKARIGNGGRTSERGYPGTFRYAWLDAEEPAFVEKKIESDRFTPGTGGDLMVFLQGDYVLASGMYAYNADRNGEGTIFKLDPGTGKLAESRRIEGMVWAPPEKHDLIQVAEHAPQGWTWRIETYEGKEIYRSPVLLQFQPGVRSTKVVAFGPGGTWIEKQDGDVVSLTREGGEPSGIANWNELSRILRYWCDGDAVFDPWLESGKYLAQPEGKVRQSITILPFGDDSLPGFDYWRPFQCPLE